MLRISFHIINIILIIFYLYPGSILGCVFYKDCNIQPNLTPDFIISSNHFYAFLLLGLLALVAFSEELKKIIIYIIFISIFLECTHLFIPNRSFEIPDLFGNLIGILLSLIIFKVFNIWRKKNEYI